VNAKLPGGTGMDLSALQALGPTLSAAATAALAFLTFFSVRAARSTAREMYESRLAHFRPLLYAVLKKHGNGAKPPNLFIRNVGPGAAMDIDVYCDGDLYSREHIAFFGPGQRIELPTSYRVQGQKNLHVKVLVTYKDVFNNPIAIRTQYRFEADIGKRLIFPSDTTMDPKIGCRSGT